MGNAAEGFRITATRARDIAVEVEQAIALGHLHPGEPLPTVRGVAADLGISHNTVAAAYRSLRDRAVVEPRGRRLVVRRHPREPVVDRWWRNASPGARLLSLNLPDPALQVHPDVEVLTAALARYGTSRVDRSTAMLHAELASVAESWFTEDGVAADHLVVGSSGADLAQRALHAYLRRGDVVAVEDPGSEIMMYQLSQNELFAAGIELDDHGVVPESLARVLDRGVRAVVITTRGQHPTGTVITPQRAEQLRAVLGRYRDVLVIEWDAGYGAAAEPPATVSGVTDHWVSIKTADLVVNQDIRVALAAADEETAKHVQASQRFDVEWVSQLSQVIMVELWERATRIVPDTVSSYAARRNALVAALGARGIDSAGDSGVNVWVPMPRTRDVMGVVIRLMERGWVVAPSTPFAIESVPGLRVTVSELVDPADVDAFADALAASLRPAP